MAAPRRDWSHLYSTRAWRELREARLLADLYTCAICGGVANVVDHKVAHRGDYERFRDPDNLQSVCKPCHDRHCQRRDKSRDGRLFGFDVDGRPLG